MLGASHAEAELKNAQDAAQWTIKQNKNMLLQLKQVRGLADVKGGVCDRMSTVVCACGVGGVGWRGVCMRGCARTLSSAAPAHACKARELRLPSGRYMPLTTTCVPVNHRMQTRILSAARTSAPWPQSMHCLLPCPPPPPPRRPQEGKELQGEVARRGGSSELKAGGGSGAEADRSIERLERQVHELRRAYDKLVQVRRGS